MSFGVGEPPDTLEMEAVSGDADKPRSKEPGAHYAGRGLRRAASSTAVMLGMLVVVLAAAAGLASILLPDDDGLDHAGADETDVDVPTTERDRSGRSTTTGSSTTTETTASTTTTTALLAVVDPPTTTSPPRPTTTQPTTTTSQVTTTTTTAPPGPTIDAFAANVHNSGCGRGATPADINWSTTNATSVTLGQVPGGPAAVPADGQWSYVCIDDWGETWRLTASGPGGTTSQDIFINP